MYDTQIVPDLAVFWVPYQCFPVSAHGSVQLIGACVNVAQPEPGLNFTRSIFGQIDVVFFGGFPVLVPLSGIRPLLGCNQIRQAFIRLNNIQLVAASQGNQCKEYDYPQTHALFSQSNCVSGVSLSSSKAPPNISITI